MAKKKANAFVCLRQKGNFLLGWLMECLLPELERWEAAGNTPASSHTELSPERIWLCLRTKRYLEKIWQVFSRD